CDTKLAPFNTALLTSGVVPPAFIVPAITGVCPPTVEPPGSARNAYTYMLTVGGFAVEGCHVVSQIPLPRETICFSSVLSPILKRALTIPLVTGVLQLSNTLACIG